MKKNIILGMIILSTGANAQEIYDFSRQSNMNDWSVVDDVVMGGRSEGTMALSEEGHGIFDGRVSLENNGGFSSVRYRRTSVNSEPYSKFRIHVKGDGKNYQFRVRSQLSEYQSYVYEFSTSGDWQVIDIPFNQMYPSWRGRKLDMPNYPGKEAREFSFLIANKRNENFRLEIDRIWME
jgi:hypothetical protein